MNTPPKYLYKYQKIVNKESLAEDYALDALFHSNAIFSNRCNFNDPFDSKVKFLKPTPQEIKSIRNQANSSEYKELNTYIQKGKFTHKGKKFFDDLVADFEKILDGYALFCVSAKNDSNLMWSHYADSHYGFCIEFNYEKIPAEKVTYQKTIPELKVADIFASTLGIIDHKPVAESLSQALKIKLEEWSYEEEYRFFLDDKDFEKNFRRGSSFAKQPYPPDAISSVIFGYRMPQEIRKFIIENMPYSVQFKEAVLGWNAIEIKEYNLNSRS